MVWAVPLSEFGGLYKQEQWLGLESIVIVERTRHLWNKVTYEVQFYLSSLPADAQNLGNVIRTHWGIENQVHWTLDVTLYLEMRVSNPDTLEKVVDCRILG